MKGTSMSAVTTSVNRVFASFQNSWKEYLIKGFWGLLVIIWTVVCCLGVRYQVSRLIDPGHHTGQQIMLGCNGLRSIEFTSDQPVTMQIGKYDNHFLFLNMDDGTIAESEVVSDEIQNIQGNFEFQFGPQVVSQGQWRRVTGNDYNTAPDIVLTSDSTISLTTYPKGAVWWMWTKWAIAGIIFWLVAGLVLRHVVGWLFSRVFALPKVLHSTTST